MKRCMDCGKEIEVGDFSLKCDACGDELCESCEPYHSWRAKLDQSKKKKDKILCPVCFAR
jgi:DNA-directed RNA polymerase subunit RPC12/RpoP